MSLTAQGMSPPVVTASQHRPMWRLYLDQFVEHRLALTSFIVILAFVAVAVGADVIAWALGIDPEAQDILNRLGPWTAANPLGTDEAGRDVLMRLIYGARVSLGVAFISAISSALIGLIVGSLSAYHGGIVDTLLMRITDSLLALPLLPILIILAAVDFGKIPGIGALLTGENSSIIKMLVIFVAFSWMVQARLVRGAILSIKERDFVLAAKTTGMSSLAIIAREIVPNAVSPVIVAVTLNVGQAILLEAALSFLGLGIQPPTPSWGNMLTNARELIYTAPMLAILPGLMILVIVMAFNFLGDGLQDALDPKAIRR
jgi:peptide/nickel transport system permease protein